MGQPLESNLIIHSTKLRMPDDPLTVGKQPRVVMSISGDITALCGNVYIRGNYHPMR